MSNESGLVFACVLDGKGGGRFGGASLIDDWTPEAGILWVHLDFRDPRARRWVRETSGLDEVSAAALLAEETRPRTVARAGGLLMDLRGVNLNPGATPDDMISIRMRIEPKRIITLRHRRLMAVQDVREQVEDGRGPTDTGEFIIDVTDCLLRRMGTSFEDLDDRIDELHERMDTGTGSDLRAEISSLRNQVIALRRYLAPQREAVSHLQTVKVDWLTDDHRERMRELANRTTRRVEDLEAARDRVTVAHEEMTSRMAENMNRTMYMLAIVAAIFLPLGLLTGLLGINVGGVPGVDHPAAFWIVCGLLVGLACLQYWYFKRKHLL